jgi:hypothetical protein
MQEGIGEAPIPFIGNLRGGSRASIFFNSA